MTSIAIAAATRCWETANTICDWHDDCSITMNELSRKEVRCHEEDNYRACTLSNGQRGCPLKLLSTQGLLRQEGVASVVALSTLKVGAAE